MFRFIQMILFRVIDLTFGEYDITHSANGHYVVE
jgi:hypothetical protein